MQARTTRLSDSRPLHETSETKSYHRVMMKHPHHTGNRAAWGLNTHHTPTQTPQAEQAPPRHGPHSQTQADGTTYPNHACIKPRPMNMRHTLGERRSSKQPSRFLSTTALSHTDDSANRSNTELQMQIAPRMSSAHTQKRNTGTPPLIADGLGGTQFH